VRTKVTIVGSENVGATTAHWFASKGLADIVLIDVLEGTPEGKGLDLFEAMPVTGEDITVTGTENHDLMFKPRRCASQRFALRRSEVPT